MYSHVYSFWGNNWASLVDLVKQTELNAIVVDVKDEAGTLLWDMDLPLAKDGGGASWRDDFDGVEDRLQMLKDAGGWAIARIACFKDTLVAEARPELAVQQQGGGRWHASEDFGWLNPYQDDAGPVVHRRRQGRARARLRRGPVRLHPVPQRRRR